MNKDRVEMIAYPVGMIAFGYAVTFLYSFLIG